MWAPAQSAACASGNVQATSLLATAWQAMQFLAWNLPTHFSGHPTRTSQSDSALADRLSMTNQLLFFPD
jgi:hypothetical protein